MKTVFWLIACIDWVIGTLKNGYISADTLAFGLGWALAQVIVAMIAFYCSKKKWNVAVITLCVVTILSLIGGSLH